MQSKNSMIFEPLVGACSRIQDLMDMVAKVAVSDAPTILLQGESGTGKNFMARLIHAKSKRSAWPFMEINCASLPETLIETELFGHVKGAFTDAKHAKLGLFEAARQGTVFLDEICEMSIATQAKLLHVIENQKFRRVGGLEDIDTDVRVIAAASTEFKLAVIQKRLREDLYFRLQLIPILIPPLRERIEDIPVFADYFLKKFNETYHKNFKKVGLEALIALQSYSWPGNVREFKNVLERIVILENVPVIEMHHLPLEVRNGTRHENSAYSMPESGMNLEAVEKDFLGQALQKTGGNQSKAAKLLGISRHTLRYRMEKFGL